MNIHSIIGEKMHLSLYKVDWPSNVVEWVDFTLAITLMVLFFVLPGTFLVALVMTVWKRIF